MKIKIRMEGTGDSIKIIFEGTGFPNLSEEKFKEFPLILKDIFIQFCEPINGFTDEKFRKTITTPKGIERLLEVLEKSYKEGRYRYKKVKLTKKEYERKKKRIERIWGK